jgi:hypothetical protein
VVTAISTPTPFRYSFKQQPGQTTSISRTN